MSDARCPDCRLAPEEKRKKTLEAQELLYRRMENLFFEGIKVGWTLRQETADWQKVERRRNKEFAEALSRVKRNTEEDYDRKNPKKMD